VGPANKQHTFHTGCRNAVRVKRLFPSVRVPREFLFARVGIFALRKQTDLIAGEGTGAHPCRPDWRQGGDNNSRRLSYYICGGVVVVVVVLEVELLCGAELVVVVLEVELLCGAELVVVVVESVCCVVF